MPIRTATALAWMLACGSLQAQAQVQAPAPAEPFHIGVAQSYTHDSNLFRLPDGSPLPALARSRSDTMATTSLLAGIDQTVGRQRVHGSATLRRHRFRDNTQFDNEGHGLNLGLDWQTIGRLSGAVSLASNRSLRRFDPSEGGAASERNLETVELADATVRLGGAARLSAEANLNQRRVDYSSARFRDRAYRQGAGSIGLRHRPAAATTFGVGLRYTKGHYPFFGDRYDRRDLDLTTRWEPGGGTAVHARLSIGKTAYERFTERNHSGLSGSLGLQWQPTGKIRISARAARETGQDSNFLSYGTDGVLGVADYARTTSSVRLLATYLASAKINVLAGVTHARRSLVNRRDDGLGSTVTQGRDRLTQLTLGPTWAPTRSLQFGCEFTRERRSAEGVGSSPYRASGGSCFGQFVLQ